MRHILAGLLRTLKLLALRANRSVRGIEVVNRQIHRPGYPEWLLRSFGAKIGSDCVIHGPLTVHNAAHDYGNLTIGRHVHLGREVLLDLTDEIEIGDEATISMGCTLLTHADVGDRPLARLYPRKVSPVRIGAGAYLAANVTVLAGSHIGELTLVGAGSVVTSPLPPGVLAAGVPARIVRQLAVNADDAAKLGLWPAQGQPRVLPD